MTDDFPASWPMNSSCGCPRWPKFTKKRRFHKYAFELCWKTTLKLRVHEVVCSTRVSCSTHVSHAHPAWQVYSGTDKEVCFGAWSPCGENTMAHRSRGTAVLYKKGRHVSCHNDVLFFVFMKLETFRRLVSAGLCPHARTQHRG